MIKNNKNTPNIVGVSGKKRSGRDITGCIIQWLTFQETVKGTKGSLNFQEWVDFHDQYEDKTSHHSSWKIVKFADKRKDIVCLLIGCTREQLEDEKFKNTELGEEWRVFELKWIDEIGETYTKIFSNKKDFCAEAEIVLKDGSNSVIVDKNYILTPRQILQFVGIDLFRNQFHTQTWVNATMADYKKVFTSIELENDQEFLDKLYPKWICTDVCFKNEIKAIKDRGGIVIRIERPSVKSNDKHISETALDKYTGFDYTIFNNGNLEDLIQTVKEILIIEKII